MICEDGKILHFRDKTISHMQSQSSLSGYRRLPIWGQSGDQKSDFQKTTVTAKLSSSDRRKASDWAPVSDMGSNPYPVIPDCYSSPTSHPDTGLSEQEPGAATPPN